MKFDFTKELTSVTGEPMPGPDEKPVNLGWLCINALLGVFEDERNLAGEEKLNRYKLASKVQKTQKGEDNDFSVEEVAKIKLLVGKMYSTSVVGPAWGMLEGN